MIDTNNVFTGVLLAGGMSRRFGAPKAFVTHKQKPFYRYSIDSLNELCSTILIISQAELVPEFSSREILPILTDLPPYQGCGPLAGIRTAMKSVDSTWYIVVPCDTPLLTNEVIQILSQHTFNNVDTIIPTVHGQKQPLISFYHKRCLPFIEQLLHDKTYKVDALFKQVKTTYIDMSSFETQFTNINRTSDMQMDEFRKG